MTILQLCDRLAIAEEVKEKVAAFDKTYRHEALAPQWGKLYSPATWEEGLKELSASLGEDADGMKILTVMLHCCLKTRDIYAERGIPEEIFYATMNFLPRFLEWQKKYYGTYAFSWAWWFPRQLLPPGCDVSVRGCGEMCRSISRRQESDKDKNYFAKSVRFGAKFLRIWLGRYEIRSHEFSCCETDVHRPVVRARDIGRIGWFCRGGA